MTIRVAHLVNPTFGMTFSGHTHYLFSLLSGWKEDGILLDLYGSHIKPLNLNSGERVYRLPPNSLWSSPQRQSRGARIRWSLYLLAMLIAHQKHYDIVHFHAINWGALLSPLILHPLGKKVVFTMSLYGNDNLSYINHQPRGKWQVALLRHFDGAIGLSPALVQDAWKHGMQNVICLPNFMAILELENPATQKMRMAARSRLGIAQSNQVMLFVGSIIKRKGVDVLVDSFVELAKRYPRLLLVLIGPQSITETNSIDESFVAKQKAKIWQAGLEERVLWTGLIKEQSLLVDFYRAADLFVLPTRSEGSPNVLAEAMVAGLPVVCTRLSGITDEIISDGINGFLVEADNVEQFVSALEQVINNNVMRLGIGFSDRRAALEKFGFENYCQHLKRFYLDLFEAAEQRK